MLTYHLGEYGIALNEFKRAVTLQPDFAHAHNNYGVVLEKTGRLEEAAFEYQEAIRLQVRKDGITAYDWCVVG